MYKLFLYTLGSFSIFLLFSSLSFASPPNAGQVLREQQQNQQTPSTSTTIEYKPQEIPGSQETQGPKIKVTAFRFVGDLRPLRIKKLEHLLQHDIDRELSFAQLQEAAAQVSQYLRKQGYAFARAYIAAQQIKDGVVEITILLGKIEGGAQGIVIDDKGVRLREQRIRQTLAEAILNYDNTYLKTDNLQRGLLLLNSLPGVSARASLDAGSSLDTTRITTHVTEGPLVTGNISTDNFGDRYTGTERYNSEFDINDPFGGGDQIMVQTNSAEHLNIEKAGYSTPLGDSGLRMGTSYTSLLYSIGKEFASLDAHGLADTADVNVTYPLILTERANLTAGFAYDYKALRDFSQDVTTDNKRINVESLTVNGSSNDDVYGGGINSYNLVVGFGNLNLDRVLDSLQSDAQGPQTDGDYNKFTYNVARLQRIVGDWSFFAALSGQVSDRDLDSSEKFILGGPSGVRAYPMGEATGDQGWVTNLELRYDVPWTTRLGNWQMVGFYDAGHVDLYNNTWSSWNSANSNQPNHYGLSGSGLGVNLFKSKNYALRISYAWPIGKNPGISSEGLDSDGKPRSGHLWLQFMVYF